MNSNSFYKGLFSLDSYVLTSIYEKIVIYLNINHLE